MKKLFVCAMALAAFVSCSKDDVAQGPALDSANKTVEILVKNGALATRADVGTDVNAGITAPGTGANDETLASATAGELYVLFAAGDEVKKILPLSGNPTTNDEHENISGEYAVGQKVENASAKGGIIYTWHNVPWDITTIAVVRIDEVEDTEYFTVAEDGTVTMTETSVAKYLALAEDEDENLTRELSEVVLFGQAPLKDTGITHEVNEITYHYWRADVEVAPKFARFEINNIECKDLGAYNLDELTSTYGFDEMDILSLSWTATNSKTYKIDVTSPAIIGRMYGQYIPTTAGKDANTYGVWDEKEARARVATAENAADAVKPANGNVWSWNVLPTDWTGMTVGLYAYAYDYALQEAGRQLTLNVIGLDGSEAGGNYAFTAGNIYKLNLQFTEGNVKDQDMLCVEVTVDIKPWTIVDNLTPVFGK